MQILPSTRLRQEMVLAEKVVRHARESEAAPRSPCRRRPQTLRYPWLRSLQAVAFRSWASLQCMG